MDALLHRPFPCPSLRVREGCGSDSHGRGTTTSPMGIRYPIPIRRGGLEGFYPSISAEPRWQGRGAALLNDAEARKAELVTEIADKEGDLAELDSQLEDVKLDIEDEQDRLECLRQRADGVARDIGELQPIATEVRGWEAAGKAERGAILDNIVAKCDGLASRIRAGVAGMRIKVEELRSRISRPLEYLMRREQPRQQSLNDVLRDAQRAADAWNRDHAAPQRTYRGRAR